MGIYASYALTGTNVLVPFRPGTPTELMMFEQIARAMEIFAVAHEYGHHHLAHGRQIGADAHAEEFEADQFALKICYEVEHVPLLLENPYLSSGAGGALLLMALETLNSATHSLGTEANAADTHPSATARIERFDSVAVLKPKEFRMLRGFRLACTRVMALMNSELIGPLRAASPELLKLWAELKVS